MGSSSNRGYPDEVTCDASFHPGLHYMLCQTSSDCFKFVYGHAEAFIAELRIEHSLQFDYVRFLCDLKVGQALYPRLIPGLRSISA